MEAEISFIIKGDVMSSNDATSIQYFKRGFAAINGEGQVVDVGSEDRMPVASNGVEIHDYGDCLIIPSFTDLHVHAGQIANMGIGYDEELLEWLVKYTMPEESKFEDLDYAREKYISFVFEMWRCGVTHSVIMPTLHMPATKLLMNMLDKAGLYACIGKVNMDIGLKDTLKETTEESLAQTKQLIEYSRSLSSRIRYTVTPRFVLSCTAELLKGLSELAEEHKLPVHSHLDENMTEIAQVAQIYPDQPDYASVYDHFKLLRNQPTVMAHCVYCTDHEVELLNNPKTFLAHCPSSNLNLRSGICPAKHYMNKGMHVGLGSDVSGGHTLNPFENMRIAIQASKMKELFKDASDKSDHELTVQEVFYMATSGGGSFFGKTGKLAKGYQFNALVVRDNKEATLMPAERRLEKLIYEGDSSAIVKRYIDGVFADKPDKIFQMTT